MACSRAGPTARRYRNQPRQDQHQAGGLGNESDIVDRAAGQFEIAQCQRGDRTARQKTDREGASRDGSVRDLEDGEIRLSEIDELIGDCGRLGRVDLSRGLRSLRPAAATRVYRSTLPV